MSRSSRFSTLLLKPIPVRDPRQIVILSRPGKDNSNQAENTGGFSFPALEQFRRFSSAGVIASSSIDEVRVIAGGTANFGRGEAVSGNSHAVLGVAPLIGRLLADADDREAAAPCASWAIAFGLATLAAMRRLSGKRSFRDMCRPGDSGGRRVERVYRNDPTYAPDFRFPIHLLTQLEPRFRVTEFSRTGRRFRARERPRGVRFFSPRNRSRP